VEQLHKIFKLCGSPSEEYWKKSKLPHATIFKPQQPYKRSIRDHFKEFPSASLALLDTLLAIEPADRGSAVDALKSDVSAFCVSNSSMGFPFTQIFLYCACQYQWVGLGTNLLSGIMAVFQYRATGM
jgi:serine/threonine protein kinase